MERQSVLKSSIVATDARLQTARHVSPFNGHLLERFMAHLCRTRIDPKTEREVPVLSTLTAQAYVSDVKRFCQFLDPFPGEKSLLQATQQDVEDFALRTINESTKRTFNRHLTGLRTFYTFLQSENEISSNPTDNIVMEKVKGGPRALEHEHAKSLEQHVKLLLRIANHPQCEDRENISRLAALAALFMYPRLKVTDVVELRVPDVAKDFRTINVDGQPVPLRHPDVRAALMLYIKNSFGNATQHQPGNKVQWLFPAARETSATGHLNRGSVHHAIREMGGNLQPPVANLNSEAIRHSRFSEPNGAATISVEDYVNSLR